MLCNNAIRLPPPPDVFLVTSGSKLDGWGACTAAACLLFVVVVARSNDDNATPIIAGRDWTTKTLTIRYN